MAQVKLWSQIISTTYEKSDFIIIKDWLRQVKQIEVGENYKSENHDEAEKSCPTTPTREPVLSNEKPEVSPTDTNFSGSTLFDTDHGYVQNISSPCPVRRLEDDDDRYSDITTIEEDDCIDDDAKEAILPAVPAPILQEDLPPPESHRRRRMVNIVSCLQCTLANLPCSRTLPTCSRCTRNKEPHCLCYRRPFPSEVLAGQSNMPVLLNVDTDDPVVWDSKLAMVRELHEKWTEKQDPQNWVLPAVDTEVRGGYMRNRRDSSGCVVKRGEGHPGEGLGRMIMVEMEVDEHLFL